MHPKASPPGLAPRLLIVDDIAANREVLSRRFERRGFKTAEADGGLKALAMIEEQAFDAVLLDIQMPDLNGLEVLRRIRQRHTPSTLPVIMVTAQTQQADVMAAVAAEANDYLTKPVEFEIALARVEAQLRRRWEALSQDPSASFFFTFAETSHSLPPHPMVGMAPEALVTAHLSPELMIEKLSGCVRYVDENGAAYLGVWGAKPVEGLHAILSARVSLLVVRRERPAAARLEWRRTRDDPGSSVQERPQAR